MIRLLIAAALTLASTVVEAHEARPLAIVIEEMADGRFSLSWRAPPSIEEGNAPAVALGAPCAALSPPPAADRLAGRAIYLCDEGLEAALLTIDYPAFNPSVSSLVRVVRRSGEVSTALLGPLSSEWRAPPPESFAGVSKSYFVLGVEHILIGIDHILFLAGLLILARTPKRILITVTGFTLAHSLTLALVALDAVRVSVPTIEALIALSIVFVAAEIARGDKSTLAWRRPVIVATTFGLLHGAGFAAVLGEIGLPQTEKIPALLFFNVGVEAGQLLFVAAAFVGALIWRILRRTMAHPPLRPSGPFPPQAGEGKRKRVWIIPPPFTGEVSTKSTEGGAQIATTAAGYALGVISAYWFVERAWAVIA
ncbi:MAG: HupE/UreJ family protein [Parvularculaceae bacterium]